MQGKLEHHRRLVAAMALIRRKIEPTAGGRRLASVQDLLTELNNTEFGKVFTRPALDERMKTRAFSSGEENAITALTKSLLNISDLRLIDPLIDRDPDLVPDVLLEADSLLSGASFPAHKSAIDGHWRVAIVYPDPENGDFKARLVTIVLSTLERDPGQIECLILSQGNTWFGNAFSERQCLFTLVRSELTTETSYIACNMPLKGEPIAGIFTVLERDSSSRHPGLVSFYFCGEKVSSPPEELGGKLSAMELFLNEEHRESLRSSVPETHLNPRETKEALPKAWEFARECGIDLSSDKHYEGLHVKWP